MIELGQLIVRILDVVERDILPRTVVGVSRGNKIFGAAILRKSDGSLVIAETNNELENPLLHGEVHALTRFFELPAIDRPATKDCIFVATHEPCSLCLSAITWAGFDNFYHLFTHEDSRDVFDIPHDLRILKEVFRLEPGGYNAQNAYWTAYSIRKAVAGVPPSERSLLQGRIDAIAASYHALSEQYRATKSRNDIPLR